MEQGGLSSSTSRLQSPGLVVAAAASSLTVAAVGLIMLRSYWQDSGAAAADRTIKKVSRKEELIQGEYDMRTYRTEGLAGGAHGFQRVFGLLATAAGKTQRRSDEGAASLHGHNTSVLPSASNTEAEPNVLPQPQLQHDGSNPLYSEPIVSLVSERHQRSDSGSTVLVGRQSPHPPAAAAAAATSSFSFSASASASALPTPAARKQRQGAAQGGLQEQISMLVSTTAHVHRPSSHNNNTTTTTATSNAGSFAAELKSPSLGATPAVDVKQQPQTRIPHLAIPQLVSLGGADSCETQQTSAKGTSVDSSSTQPQQQQLSRASIEEQLRTLERRREHQRRLTQAFVHDGAVAPAVRQPSIDSTNSSTQGGSELQNTALLERSQEEMSSSSEVLITQPSQQDRRADDLRVQHRDGSALYSISLTYHDDATGSTRTIDARALPPLNLSAPPPPISPPAADTKRAAIDVHKSKSSAAAAADEVVAAAPSASSAAHASKPFGAPLPPTEPTSGPRLQGVTGRRGEMVIGAFLGGGACGKVYECLNTETGQLLAAKQIVFDAKDPKLRQRLKQLELELEVLTLASKHGMKWVVGFLGAEKRGHSVLMYLEYCENGSLLDYIAGGKSHDAAVWGGAGSVPPPPLPSVMLYGDARGSGNYSPDPSGDRLQQQQQQLSSVSMKCNNPSSPPLGPSSPSSNNNNGKGDYCYSSRTVTNTTTWGSYDNGSHASGMVSSNTSNSDGLLSDAMQPQMPPLSITEVRRFAKEILLGLHFLHQNGYAHLDVKTANVLITAAESCRLADLGCAMRLTSSPSDEYPVLCDHEAITELRGTALYMAPEMIRFERHVIGSPADVWSLGCVVMEMCTGSAPWRHIAKDKLRVLYRVGSARTELPLPPLLAAWAEEAKEWLDNDNLAAGPDDTPHWLGGGEAATIPITPGSPSAAHVASFDVKSSSEARVFREEQRRLMQLYVALEDFVCCCVSIRPGDRATTQQLLSHPFLQI